MKLLDLFSGAGGAAMGYYRAGFTEIVGVDIKPQPRYPFEFVQGDALEYLAEHGGEFDFIHASPPCQAYTKAQKIMKNIHPDLVEPTRKLLKATGKPYVIENVPGAPLINPVMLIGTMFNLLTIRPRLFECNFNVPFVLFPVPGNRQAKMGRSPKEGEYIQPVGNFSGIEYAKRAMGIDWMTRDELKEAIPPAYTEWIGRQLLQAESIQGTHLTPTRE